MASESKLVNLVSDTARRAAWVTKFMTPIAGEVQSHREIQAGIAGYNDYMFWGLVHAFKEATYAVVLANYAPKIYETISRML